jgi:uncharacterized DUF497 family protein
MPVLSKIKGFEWDKANFNKSYQKHGTTPNETEEIFLDENLRAVKDIKHSQDEKRFTVLGKTFENKILFVVFTIRKDKIRVISARKANQKERNKYEQKTKKNP